MIAGTRLRARAAPSLRSIRRAEARDAIAIRRLLDAACVSPPLDAEALVLDVAGEIAAVVYVAIDAEAKLGLLRLMLLDAELVRNAARDVEERMIGAALALCGAHGCAELVLPGRDRG